MYEYVVNMAQWHV